MSKGSRRVQFAAVEIPCVVHFSTISECSWRNSIVGRRINFSGGSKIAGAPKSQITARSTDTSHFGTANCTGVKIQKRAEIQTTVLRGSYVVEDGTFQAQKRCGSKPLLTAAKSCVLSMSYPRTAHGHPLVARTHPDPEEDSSNEQGLNFVARNHMLIQRPIREQHVASF
jgi:hypothetical protein